MAIRLNDITAIINRTSGLVAASSDYCCCFWFQSAFVPTNPDYVAPWVVTDAGYTAWVGIFGHNTAPFHIDADNGGGNSVTSGQAVAAGVNCHFGYRRSGTTHFFYVNGVLIGSTTEDMSAVTFAEMLLGNDRFSLVSGAIRIWDFAEWSSSKSVTTLRNQMASYGVAVDATNLRTFTPLASDLLDDSGNGNHWSAAGNYEFVTNPTLPTNLSALTATEITSLPYSQTVTAYNLPLWYKRTPGASENYIGAFGFGGLTGYSPSVFVWSGDGSTEWPSADFQVIGTNVPVQAPVVPGDPIYFEFRSDFGGADAELQVSFVNGPNTNPPTGVSILVSDEQDGFGAALISPTDGEIYRFIYPGVPGSEESTNLINGSGRIVVIATDADPEIYLYSPSMELIDTIDGGSDRAIVVTSNKTDTFYLGFLVSGANDYVKRMSEDGVIDSEVIGPLTSTTTTNIAAIAVNADETILYYQTQGNNLGAIHRWNLLTNSAMSDLVASPGVGYFGLEVLLTTPDGGVIGGFDQFLTGTQGFLRKYAADGSVEWTYDTGALGIDYHGAKLFYGENYPDDFWLVVHVSSGHSRYINLNGDTGAEISVFLIPTFTAGAYDGAETADPEARFGPSPSCAMLLLTSIVEESEAVIGPLVWWHFRRNVPAGTVTTGTPVLGTDPGAVVDGGFRPQVPPPSFTFSAGDIVIVGGRGPEITRGGAGGGAGGSSPRIIRVNSRADSNSISQNGDGTYSATLRGALSTSGFGPRTLIFEVSGYFEIGSNIVVTDPYLTVAGQTAPAPGICIRATGGGTEKTIYVKTHDTIWQHIRVRPGPGNTSAIQIYNFDQGSVDITRHVFDHCSISWFADEGIKLNGPSNSVMLWRCIIAEGLHPSTQNGVVADDGHGLGWDHNDDVAVIQCLLAHNFYRNPQWNCGSSRFYLANNLLYGFNLGMWWFDASSNGFTGNGDIIGNYFRRDGRTIGSAVNAIAVGRLASGCRLYVSSDQVYDNSGASPNLTQFALNHGGAGVDPRVGSSTMTAPAGYTPLSAAATYEQVLATAGCRPRFRTSVDNDGVDSRIINEVRTRTGGLVSHPSDVGGYPPLTVNARHLSIPSNPFSLGPDGRRTLFEYWTEEYAQGVEP